MRVQLYGYYGHRNIGDDALLLAAATGLVRECGATSVSFSGKMPPILSNIPARNFAPRHDFPGATRLHRWREAVGLRRADCVVLGGGSILRSRPTLDELERKISVVKQRGGRAVGIGVSVGPFLDKSSQLSFVRLAKKLDFLGVRDATSLERVKQLEPDTNVKLTGDLAPLLRDEFQENTPPATIPTPGILGISIVQEQSRAHDAVPSEEITQSVIRLVEDRCFPEFFSGVRLFSCNDDQRYPNDTQLNRRLGEALSSHTHVEQVAYSGNTLGFIERFTGLSLMLSTRLHASIFAALMNVPLLVVSYAEKCRAWANFMGIAADQVLNPDELASDRILQVPTPPDQNLPARMYEAARSNLSHVKDILAA